MSAEENGIAPNAKRLLFAGFMAILAAGVGFAIRGGIFDNWAREFGFTGAQLGAIGGAGFSGFCFGIIIGGVIVDKIGYGRLVAVALVCHVLSAFVTFGASTPENAYNLLFWGMFIFAFANGTLEAVANPLVATLFPHNRTHYLNILHASWPAGMILGVVAGWILDDKLELDWKLQLALYLVPTVIYGIMFMGQHFPKSEAAAKGANLGEMMRDVGILGGAVACYLLAQFFQGAVGFDSPTALIVGGILLVAIGIISRRLQKPGLESYAGVAVCALIAVEVQIGLHLPTGAGLALMIALICGLANVMKWSAGSVLLFILFVTHALVGAVELGTDGWIQNITGNLFTSEQGKYLFLWTSAIMFGLRFCAHFIERTLKLSPLGLLFVCAVLACIGLNLASTMHTFGMALVALGIYAVGKTFFWPTMLAVVGDRFPQTGAVAMSMMGGIGMLSAGLIGGPGLGYCKDRFSGEDLKTKNAALFDEYKAAGASKFLNIESTAAFGLDGKKLGGVQGTLDTARKLLPKGGPEDEAKKLADKTAKAEAKLKAADDKLKEFNAELESIAAKGLKEWDEAYQTNDDRAAAIREEIKGLAIEQKKATEDLTGLKAQKTRMAELKAELEKAGVLNAEGNKNLAAALAALTPEERAVQQASIVGDRRTLKADAWIPATMAVIYFLLFVYFKTIGGYKPVHIAEDFTGGTEGPMQA